MLLFSAWCSPTRDSSFAPISDEAKAFDERLRYSTDELLAIRAVLMTPPMLAEVRARVPRDLRADLWKELL